MQKVMRLVGNDQCSLLRLVPACTSRATIFRRVQCAPFLLPLLVMQSIYLRQGSTKTNEHQA